jgi:hypothetical protein
MCFDRPRFLWSGRWRNTCTIRISSRTGWSIGKIWGPRMSRLRPGLVSRLHSILSFYFFVDMCPLGYSLGIACTRSVKTGTVVIPACRFIVFEPRPARLDVLDLGTRTDRSAAGEQDDTRLFEQYRRGAKAAAATGTRGNGRDGW